jgi:hypothetical protein
MYKATTPRHSGQQDINDLVQRNVKKNNPGNKAGRVFSFNECFRLVTTCWTVECGMIFPDWCCLAFCAITLILAALRTEQLERFRTAGLEGISHGETTYEDGIARPYAVIHYPRVKNHQQSLLIGHHINPQRLEKQIL